MTTTNDGKPLSIVHDTHGHTIERYKGDVLVITHTSTGNPVSETTYKRLSAWYWAFVGIHGHDPADGDN